MRTYIFYVCELLRDGIISLLGGWDLALQTLILFLAMNCFIDCVLLSHLHKFSNKTKHIIENVYGVRKKLCRIIMILLLIIMVTQMDCLLQTSYLRNGACYGFITTEIASIIRKAKLIGIPLPAVIYRLIDILKDKIDDAEN